MSSLHKHRFYIEPAALAAMPARFCYRAYMELQAGQDRWFLFLPVFLAGGVGFYFLLPFEPSPLLCLAAGLAAISLPLLAGRRHFALPFFFALAACMAGLALAKFESERVRTPLIGETRHNVLIKGRIRDIEAHLPPDADRWTIAPDFIEGLAPQSLPKTIRLSVRPDYRTRSFQPGEHVEVSAILFPPPGPAVPGGFDFAQRSWFLSIGGVGAARSAPVLLPGEDAPSLAERLTRLRNRLAEKVYAGTGGQSGAIATALILGTRGYIPEEARILLRDTGLAHILAISGLHMACFAGVLFFLTRLALALFTPRLALRYPIKKWALVPAIPGAVIYLFISGGAIATQRAFLMFMIVALAVLAGKPVLTMRNVALAALAILIVSPSSLTGASFQMSFAATMAIIAAYETVPMPGHYRSRNLFMRWISGFSRAGFTLFLTSLAAWAVTGLLAAYHFNRVATFSALAANMLVLPVFTIVVMPAAAAALTLMPFGLEWVALTPMRAGLDVILALAAFCGDHFGRAVPVASPHTGWALVAAAGVLWFCLWQRPWRHAGLALALLAVLFASALPAARPDMLIEREGRLVAMRDGEGRLWFSHLPRNHFTAGVWLRRDGDSRKVEEAQDAGLFACTRNACRSEMRDRPVVVLLRSHYAKPADCVAADIVVSASKRKPGFCPDAKLVLARDDFASGGAHALFFTPDGIKIETAAGGIGQRPWNRRTKSSAAGQGLFQ